MSGWDGAGNFLRVYSWVADALAGIDISSSRMDTDTDNITANGFVNCLTRDGQGSATADLPMNNFKHLHVGDGADIDQYASVDQIQKNSLLYVIAGGTANALTATYPIKQDVFTDGMEVCVTALLANTTATPTLKVNTLAAKTITKFGGTPLVAGDIAGPNHCLRFRYVLAEDKWELLNPATAKATAPWAVAAGTANAITAAYTPANGSLTDGLLLGFRALLANTATTPTFAPDGLTAHTITKGGGSPVAIGDIRVGGEYLVRYDLADTRWELLNPQLPALGIPVVLDTGNLSTGTAVALSFDFSPYSAYSRFEIQIDNMTRSGNGALTALFSINGGSSYLGANYAWQWTTMWSATGAVSAADAAINMTDSVGVPQSLTVNINNMMTTGNPFMWGNVINGAYYFEGYNTTTNCNAVQIRLSANNVTGGKYRIIGYV